MSDIAAAVDGRELWRALGRSGRVEKVYAGTDVCRERLADLVRELDGGHPTGPVLAVCPQLAVALPILGAVSSPVAATAWRSAVAGDGMISVAATDDGAAGSDLMGLRTSARVTESGVTVSGRKRWIASAQFADWHLVLARHSDRDHFTSFTWLLVPAGAPGVRVVPAGTDFFSGGGVGHLQLDDVRLPRDHVIGRIGYGMALFARHLSTERYLSATWAAALCRRAVGATRHRAAARRVRDEPLWRHDGVRERLARCLVEIRKLDALCAGVAGGPDGPPAPVDGMVLKIAGADTVATVLDVCAQLWGADGFGDAGMQRLRAEAAMFGIAGGATEALLAAVADRLPELLEVTP
ncbi:acyl-CoA dehydrogenase [Amycolatopsis mediterranei]|uniref:acyl-CoA dehydrogenase family protein n=1 Tax=Amycolatopsis mediterranei TaxID=33910 RepID=UPI0034482AA1